MGVGKSTVGQLLADKLSVSFYPEPYEYNPGITYQTYSALETQMIQLDLVHDQHQKHSGVFDTSPLSVLMFSRHFYKQGDISANDLILLNHRARVVPIQHADFDLFLVAKPQAIYDRIIKRGRDFEDVNADLITDIINDCHHYANKIQSGYLINCESEPQNIVNQIMEIVK